MKLREYGGYLPLELKKEKAYYDYDKTMQLSCNSGLTALYCALTMIKPIRVFLPHFICPTVTSLIQSMNLQYVQYYISDNFEPENIDASDNDCVIIVNYFGLNTQIVKKCCEKFRKVIIDNTQAFFAEPVFRDGVYNIYSCRKFIGTADGGYLIGLNLQDIFLEDDYSSERAVFLLMQYEYGTNGAYKYSIDNYEQIKDVRRNMSKLTEAILNSVDYQSIIIARQKNFQVLNMFLGSKNRLSFNVTEQEVGYTYPFMFDVDIKKKLVENKIYVPTLWSEKIDNFYKGKAEYKFSKYICHLPIDQRYDEIDMKHIGQTVLDILEEQ